jgi:hypothetical protein
VLAAHRLPLTCDVRRLQDDLDAVAPSEWAPHFNTQYYDGDWSGVPLRAHPEYRVPLATDPTRDDYADTAAMACCRYVPELLGDLPGDVQSVRFLRLAAGAAIKEHRDFGLCLENGAARLHIPVRTHADVDFRVAGERIRMAEGECWYVNFDLPHSVANRGTADRVHLVIDLAVDPGDAELSRWFTGPGR